jgi:two-component system sensor histidine kinase RegB
VNPAPQHALPHLSSPLNLKRLVWLRTIVIPGAAVALLAASRFYQLPIRLAPLITIIVVLALVNFWTWRRLRHGAEIQHAEFFTQMLIDVVALTGILYYSGGATNPFAYLFLLPLAISATVLPRRYTWPLAGITAACYTFLLLYRVPLPPFSPPGDDGSTFIVHVIGMWLGFVLSAVLIAQFVVSMGQTLRDQERSLAEARERALRDERVVALATLAAGAAHELSTPLGTMALVTAELAEEYPSEEYPELHKNIELLRGQIRKCKDSLSVISAAAGAGRADEARPVRVDAFIRHAVTEVRRLRPGAVITVDIPRKTRPPEIIVERTLTQALLNVLHNAVDASPQDVRVGCTWTREHARIDVTDRGPGISLKTIDPGSRPARSSKDSGLGLGLFLTHTALSHFGGEISFADAPGGGACVTIRLPLATSQTGIAS